MGNTKVTNEFGSIHMCGIASGDELYLAMSTENVDHGSQVWLTRDDLEALINVLTAAKEQL